MSRTRQGFRVELSPTAEQKTVMGRHAGLSRVVENFCLDRIKAAFGQRKAEESYDIPADQLTRVPWTAVDLERLWRQAHPSCIRGSARRDCPPGCRRRPAGSGRPG